MQVLMVQMEMEAHRAAPVVAGAGIAPALTDAVLARLFERES
jgi:hypothetical protein